MMRIRGLFALVLLSVLAAASCARPVPPPVVAAPRFPEFIVPVLDPPDARLAELTRLHDIAWRWLQAGDLARAERELQAILKRSQTFYPSEAALGYVAFARRDYEAAVGHFDRVLKDRPAYVSALVGRGEALLALHREPEALAAFELALKHDPSLIEIGRRVEVLRARAAQEMVAAARRAAQAGRLDEAARLFEQAIAASPDSAFLQRDLADVEAKRGRADEALARYRRAAELDPSDVLSRTRIGEILDARGDVEGALATYTAVYGMEPSAEIRRRITALEARIAYLKLPAEYRAITDQPAITRGDLAALIGHMLQSILESVPAEPVLITDVRTHWASSWILATAGAGVMLPYENHTFQPATPIQRSDLAQAVSRLLKIIALRRPELLKQWQGRQQKMSDVGVSNLHYADASLSVAADIVPLNAEGAFELPRPVTGAEAIEAVTRLQRLFDSVQ